MEYKNSTVANATNPEAFEFKLNEDKHYTKIARKYYDSLIYINNRTGWGNRITSYNVCYTKLLRIVILSCTDVDEFSASYLCVDDDTIKKRHN